MDKRHLVPGTVYAYRETLPALLVEKHRLWEFSNSTYVHLRPTASTTQHDWNTSSVGYLAVLTARECRAEECVPELEALELPPLADDFDEAQATAEKLINTLYAQGLVLACVNSRYLTGQWRGEQERLAAERARRAAQAERAVSRRRAADATYQAQAARLRGLGIDHVRAGGASPTFKLSASAVRRLLDMIPEA